MKQYTNDIHFISNAEYHQSYGISRSMLMEFKKSPYHYWHRYISEPRIKSEPTPDMIVGSAVHTLTLEPEHFQDEFFLLTTKTRPRRDSPGYKSMIESAEGRMVITSEEHEQAFLTYESIKADKRAFELLQDCKIEHSIYFDHAITGLQCKVRPDAYYGGIIIDLKTTADASERAFQNSALNYGYFLQAAMMFRAFESLEQKMEKFVFLVAEKKPPYCVAIYTLSDEGLNYGLFLFNELMYALAQCKETNHWPGYPIKELKLPGYLKFDEKELEIE
jgi:PDDEXK-like domain of unknown function (DUF3799)